jgi:hypothetical protein
MKAPDTVIGKTVKCPACQTQFSVTGSPPPPEPAPVMAPLVGDEEPAHRTRPSGGSSAFVEFLLFRRMIAPLVIQIIFWVGTVLMLFGGLIMAVLSLTQISQVGAVALIGTLTGFAYMLFGPIVLRVYCEVLIIFFRMYETMKDVKEGIERLRKD